MEVLLTSQEKVFLGNKNDIYLLLEMERYLVLKMFLRKLTMKQKKKGLNHCKKLSIRQIKDNLYQNL